MEKDHSKHCYNSRLGKTAPVREMKDCFSYRKQVRQISYGTVANNLNILILTIFREIEGAGIQIVFCSAVEEPNIIQTNVIFQHIHSLPKFRRM